MNEDKNVTIECSVKENICELCKLYRYNIINMNILDTEMIDNIRNMTEEEKVEIIITFNRVMKWIIETID
jgi:fructose/tagatose bisphosphate aldolase